MLELIGFLAVMYIFYEFLQSNNDTSKKIKDDFNKAKSKIIK